jgi:hypothetical protein
MSMNDRKLSVEEIMAVAFETEASKGWHDVPRSLTEDIALVHTELSEAVEEVRDRRSPQDIRYGEQGKPEGIAVEYADAIIRLCASAARHKIPLVRAIAEKLEFNLTRSPRHGGKAL